MISEIGVDYPSSLPLLALSCSSMRYAFIRYLTIQLADKCQELLGFQMVHALVEALMDLLHEAADPQFKLPGANPMHAYQR